MLTAAERELEKRNYHTDWMRQWRQGDPRGPMLVSARSRAKAKGLDFGITKADIPIPAVCPVLGIPIYPSEGRHGPNSPTVDRINPRRGYVKGNVRVVSYRANNLKSDMTEEECRLILKDLEDHL